MGLSEANPRCCDLLIFSDPYFQDSDREWLRHFFGHFKEKREEEFRADV
jgi:hypothetical protein